MATTTNYGWTTPDDTALVKDGASAIRTLGSSVDTTTKALNPSTTLGDIEYRSSTPNTNTRLPLGTAGQVLKVNSGATAPEWSSDNAGMTNPMTTTGDTIYSSSGSTPARLGIGTTGQILTVAGGLPSWAAAPTAGSNWSLLNAGGTALTGATTITVSGISAKDKIMVLVQNAGTTGASSIISVRLNTDTGSNYALLGYKVFQAGGLDLLDSLTDTYITLGRMANNAASKVTGTVLLTGCNSSGVKVYQSFGSGNTGGGTGNYSVSGGGYYNSSSTISSVSVFSAGSDFDEGTVYVYTSA
jgi:hypothetical protein